jgi:hypothetical protein
MYPSSFFLKALLTSFTPLLINFTLATMEILIYYYLRLETRLINFLSNFSEANGSAIGLTNKLS